MIRFFGKLLLFVLLLGSIKWLLVYVSDSLNPQADTLTGTIRLLSALKVSTNTVFIGSSRTYTALDPIYFDSLTQQTHSFNLGVSSLFMPYTADLCEEVLERPELGIRYILFELSLPTTRLNPFQGKPREDAIFYWHYEVKNLFPRTAKTDSILNDHLNDQVYYALSPSRHLFLDKVVELKAKLTDLVRQKPGPTLFPDTVRYPREATISDPERIKGYLSSTRQLPEKSAALLATHARSLKIYQEKALPMDSTYRFYYERLNALQRLATQKGVTLLFYLPNRMNDEEAAVLPAFFRQLAPDQRLGIGYDSRFDQLFEPRHSKDEVHLNDKGARIYTGLLAEAFRREVRYVP